MGSMIGSGIFIVSADIAGKVHTPGMLMLAWVCTAVVTILGALAYGELAAMFPKAGGQYVYLREAYGKRTAFLYGWSLFSVIQTGTIAAVGVAFAKFLGVFAPWCSPDNALDLGILKISSQQGVSIAVIVLLSLFNLRDVRNSATLQNIFTIAKVLALIFLVLAGVYFAFQGKGSWNHFQPMWPDTFSIAGWSIFGAAMTGSLFSADAWNNITFTAGEIKKPERNLPFSLLLGTGTVLFLYLAVNLIYIYMMPIEAIANAPQQRVGTAFMETIMGNTGKYIMAALIMLSTFGCLNGLIFTAPRAYYAMAEDGLFLPKAKNLNKNGVPAYGTIIQMVWASALCLSGQYSDLLDYLMIVVMFFYILTVGALFILRKKMPDVERPYKAIGYPILPALYILLAIVICVVMVVNNPENAGKGLLIMLIGLPIFQLINRKKQI